MNGWTGKSFSMLLELLSDAFPDENTLPKSSYETKNVGFKGIREKKSIMKMIYRR